MPPSNPTPLPDELKSQLHPILNGDIDIDKIYVNTSQKFWWQCQEHPHAYLASARHKAGGQGCSVCSGKQIVKGFNDLATLSPEIAAQWHPTKNNGLLPAEVSRSYSKKVWWVCDLGHEFEALASNRKTSSHCPTCSGRVILKGFNDAASLYPHLAKAFHPTLNPGVNLEGIGKSFPQKIWWKCENGHDVHALISNALNKVPCEYCIGRKIISGYNDLATTNPEIIKFWHPTKNLPLTPESVTKGTKKKIWWVCENGHEDFILPNNKIKIGPQCSYCNRSKMMTGLNDFATLYPEPAQEWHPELNGDDKPSMFAATSSKKFWWQCKTCGEAWSAALHNRGRHGTGCPYCSGNKIKVGLNDLKTRLPELASQWHPTKNGELTPSQVTIGSPQNVWWQCLAGHEWQTRIRDRVAKNNGCGECYRSGIISGTVSFTETHAHLLTEWDYEKNSYSPEVVSAFSSRKIWWKCATNPEHSWEAPMANRTRGAGCPQCWKGINGSNAEDEVADFLRSLGLTIDRNRRDVLGSRFEVDIYLPEFNTAIEYNGLYWHSEAAGKDRKYHLNKYNSARENGISLIQIWEDDWLERKDIVKLQLAYRFNKMKAYHELEPTLDSIWFEKHYARKLIFTVIDYKEATEFLDATHIQGGVRGTHYYALKTKAGKVVAVLVMTKTDREGVLLLARYSAKGIVAGGFSKLLKYAVKDSQPNEVITFADNSLHSGGIYADSGFVNAGVIAEDYMYVKNKKRYHKFGFRLDRIKANPDMVYYDGLTENELTALNGYSRIWDSGKTKWVLTVSNQNR